MNNIETVKCILPEYLDSYLINCDPSDLTDEEFQEVIDYIQGQLQIYPVFYCIECSEYPFFSWRNDMNNLGGNCLEYTFIINQ